MSFVTIPEGSDFTLENLPYGVFRTTQGEAGRIGVAIGNDILVLGVLVDAGLFDGPLMKDKAACLKESTLNSFMALGRPAWNETRATITRLLSVECPVIRDNAEVRAKALVPQASVTMELPAAIGDYTDFYCSKDHAMNCGIIFRGKDNPLFPNWLHLPVGYHGRASSIVPSGKAIVRPKGQTQVGTDKPTYGPTKNLDFELEMAFFVGPGNEQGRPVDVNSAHEHIFGMVIMNDWSARDVQRWEYVPLGPFNAKNFATSISPWIITLDALEPFLCPAPPQDPPVLEYLSEKNRVTYDIALEVRIVPNGHPTGAVVTRSNFKNVYWTMAQMLAHHTSTGCNLRPGDLIASGTVSGPTEDSRACMLELTYGGTKDVVLGDTGLVRRSLQDGDSVVMTGAASKGSLRVGFGTCAGKILPAIP